MGRGKPYSMDLRDPEIVRRRIKNAVEYRRQIYTAGLHRIIPRESRRYSSDIPDTDNRSRITTIE